MKTKEKEFSFRERGASFRFAFNGIRAFFRQEHNARIHFIATIAAFFGAWWFGLSRNEIISLVLVIGFVWSAEIFNTSIERIMDFIAGDFHPQVKLIKDIAAAAVLIAAFAAIVTGAIIFIPKIIA